MAAVEGHLLPDVHIGDTVAVGQQEGLIFQVFPHPLDPAAGHGGKAGVHHGDLPALGIVPVDDHLVSAVGEVEGDVRGVQKIVRKIFLDDMLLVARADDEFVEAVGGIELHDVPQNGHPPQLHHGLGAVLALVADPGSESPCQNDNLHGNLSVLIW